MPRKGVAAQVAAWIPTLFILGSLTVMYLVIDVLLSVRPMGRKHQIRRRR